MDPFLNCCQLCHKKDFLVKFQSNATNLFYTFCSGLNVLNCYGLVMPYGVIDVGSSNGLAQSGNKPLPERVLIYCQSDPYKDLDTRSEYLGHAEVIIYHSKQWDKPRDVITYPCPRYRLLAPKSSYFNECEFISVPGFPISIARRLSVPPALNSVWQGSLEEQYQWR